MAMPRAGTQVLLKAQLTDTSQPSMPLFDPSDGVTLILKDPTANVILNAVQMSKLSTGIYVYRYQTAGASPLGRWIVSFTASDNGATHVSHDMEAFTLINT